MADTQTTTQANETKLQSLQAAVRDLLGEVLTRGFYGQATVEIVVADGTIQVVRSETTRQRRY